MTVSPQMKLTFRPMKNECVVVMRGDKVAGTIRRYQQDENRGNLTEMDPP
jgi:hypothetical protein